MKNIVMEGVRAYWISVLVAVLATVGPIGLHGQAANDRVIHLGDMGGRPTVEATIGSAGPFLFILNTGSRAMIIEDSLARELRLTVIRTQQVGAPGSDGITANVYALTNLKVGDYTLDAGEIIGIGALPQPGRDQRLYGVISYWALGHGISELNLAESTLRVYPNRTLDANDPTTLRLRWNPPFPFPTFTIDVGGFRHEAHLDTGSPAALTLNIDLADSLSLDREPSEVGRVKMVGRETQVLGANLKGAATVGSMVLTNPELRFIERVPGINVGSGLLRNAIVRIDHENDLISIIPVDQ